MKDPIFICGHRKSGTTLLHNLFDDHPDLLVYPIDLNLLYAYFPIYNTDQYSDTQRIDRLKKILFRDLEVQLANENISGVIDIIGFENLFFARLNGADLTDMKKIITALLESYGETMGRLGKIPLVKETSIELYLNDIIQWFPNSKFIHLVRDPRDNFAALKSGVQEHYSLLGEDEKQTLASLIFRTRQGLEMGKLNLDYLGAKSYKFINFSKLVANPHDVMIELSEFLTIEFLDSLIIPSRLGRASKGNNFDGNKFKGISAENTNRWRERISVFEAKIIEFHLGKLMKDFGYSLEYNRLESAEFASEFYKWENYKYFFSDRFN